MLISLADQIGNTNEWQEVKRKTRCLMQLQRWENQLRKPVESSDAGLSHSVSVGNKHIYSIFKCE